MREILQQINMVQNPDDKREFAYEIFNIDADMQYYVTANEKTSDKFTVEVFEMPRIDEISVSYTYPEYTNLNPIVQQGSGDIQAVVGSTAEIRMTANKVIQSATFSFTNPESTETVEENAEGGLVSSNTSDMLIVDGNILSKTIDIDENGKYNVTLLCIDGFNNEIPIEYTIKAMPDKVPEVVIKEPGRDVKATKLEEVKIVAEVTDDYGISNFSLKYRIGPGELKEIPFEIATDPVVDNVSKHLQSGTHTFYLEEYDVEPGEIISYYAHAIDNNTLTGPGEASSEIYFIEIKPFNQRLAEGEPMEGNMPNPFLGLIATQKQIIRETWKHVNSQPTPITAEFESAVKATAKKQSELRDKTQEVTDQLSTMMQDSQIAPEIFLNLEEAIDVMGEATDELNAVRPLEAIPQNRQHLSF